MSRCVMDSESVPYLAANILTKCVRQRFAAVDVEIVHDQMDGVGLRVLHRHITGCQSELERRAVGRGVCEMATGFGLYGAENIGGTTALVLAVAPGLPPRLSRRGGADVSVQRNRLLVQAHHRLFGIVELFIRFQ